jgi:hypothetical protein
MCLGAGFWPKSISRSIRRAHISALDALPETEGKSWHGHIYVDNPPGKQEGLVAQQIYEAGGAWDELIDHPAWMKKITHFLGTDVPRSFDAHHGPAFMDEAFTSARGPGKSIPLHSGGFEGVTRCQYRYHAGVFHCGQVNVLMAFNDIGLGDGATMVIPGSHKSNFRHLQRKGSWGKSMEGGSAERVNPGQRRMAVYRYGPRWGCLRYPFKISDAMLARLTPERPTILEQQPQSMVPPGAAA